MSTYHGITKITCRFCGWSTTDDLTMEAVNDDGLPCPNNCDPLNLTFNTEDDALEAGSRYVITEDTYGSIKHGTYLGWGMDEDDVRYLYFADGDINGHPQSMFGFPADRGDTITKEA
jgi:hypothetical protein